MLILEHIGIAVKNLNISEPLFEHLLGYAAYKTEEIESEGVITKFFQSGDTKLELLSGTRPESVISKFIDKKGEGIHHLAFNVENIIAEVERLKDKGFEFIADIPKKGADNKIICFLHPKSTNGVLIELCQTIE